MSENKNKCSNYSALWVAILFLVGIVCGFIFKFTNSLPICISISVIIGLIAGFILKFKKKK